MEALWGLEAVKKSHKGAVITIGNFDGVHLGHQKILQTVRELADELKAPRMAVTFDPHPLKALSDREFNLLTPSDARARLLGRYGMDAVLFINFTREFARMDPEDFIKDILVDLLGAKAIIVGHNYSFGKGKQGTTDLLRRRGKKYGFQVRVVRSVLKRDKVISSSRIRTLVSNGNVERACDLLGRPYSIRGNVIQGAGRGGPILNTPTANITTPYEAIPKDGVYAVRVLMGTKRYDGVANIGNNPTFKDADRSYEVHIFDFTGDLRGKDIKLIFIQRLRDEMKFPNPETLLTQINEDIACAKDILGAG
jgi:riboflavin kinase/FMN adenylyltransferase